MIAHNTIKISPIYDINTLWQMLMSALGYSLRIQLKKIFMEKEKIAINILTAFYIFHKSDVKTFLK